MIGVDIKVTGWKELTDALRELGSRITTKVIYQGLRAGAVVVRKAFREAAPMRTTGYTGPKKIAKGEGGTRSPGYLKKNIGYYKRKGNRNLGVYRIGPRQSAFYGRLVETGHAAGKRKKYGMHITQATGMRMVGPHPWMTPVFTAIKDTVEGTVKARMWRGVKEEAEKLKLKTQGMNG